MPFHSPLRYPGGKGLLLEFVRQVIRNTSPQKSAYVEPFAGGAAVAIGLLQADEVDSAVIGDTDPAIAAFWRAAINRHDDLRELIRACEVTIDTWHEQAHTLSLGPTGDDLTLGFAAFFLNRTNRSGILRARPIGGLNQDGPWPLNCRFNKPNLIERLKAVHVLGKRITVYEGDALQLITRLHNYAETPAFIYADPPYLTKSTDLYLDTMTYSRHRRLAAALLSSSNSWMVSYDAEPLVKNELYPHSRILRFSLRHSAARPHLGTEVMAFSPDCELGDARAQLKNSRWLRREDKARTA
jgi:DNA adenine methylase